MNASFPGSYPAANPFNPFREAYGNFSVNLPALVGGGFAIFDLSGSQPSRQLIQLQSPAGGDPPPTVRIAIVRIQ